MSNFIKESLFKATRVVLHPLVVLWFWFFRWVVHNKLVYRLRPLGKSPSLFSYPFIFFYYLSKLIKISWAEDFANYGLKHYVPLIEAHYSPRGLGRIPVKSKASIDKLYESLFSRFAYYLDNSSMILECKNGDTFLDAACGFGENIKELSFRFPDSKIQGFDVSPNAVTFVNDCGYSNVYCEEGSVTDFDYLSKYDDNSFDWVLYSHAFSFILAPSMDELITLRKNLLSELFRISRNGLVMLEGRPYANTRFELEQNTRASLHSDITLYFEGLGGELYIAHNRGVDYAYILINPEFSSHN